MSEKYLIFGATGSVGSSLAEQLKNSGNDIHLVARNETEVKAIAEKLGFVRVKKTSAPYCSKLSFRTI